MGTSASSPQKRHATLTDEQKLIKNLGEYFPFSDSELRVLYKCFSEHNTSANKTQGCPFILDLAMFAPTHSTEEEYKTHEHHLKYIFEHVLPPRFSSKLEAVAFRQLLALENNQTEGRTQQRLEAFLEAVTKCCGRRNAHSSLEIIYQCCCYEDSSSATPEPFGLIDLSYRLALTSHIIMSNDSVNEEKISSIFSAKTSALHSLAKSLEKMTVLQNQNHGGISMEIFIEWASQTMPLISAILPTFMHYLLFRDLPFSPGRQHFLFPILNDSSSFFETDFSSKLFCFSCMSLALGGAWHRLYTSDVDGFSFNRLQLALLSYAGPTIMIIRAAKNGSIFGAFTSSAWKESKDFFGNSDCLLYQIEPSLGIYRPRRMDRNFMYCNSAARSKGYDQLAHGIGFGGSSNLSSDPRLYVSETFEDCIASASDTTCIRCRRER